MGYVDEQQILNTFINDTNTGNYVINTSSTSHVITKRVADNVYEQIDNNAFIAKITQNAMELVGGIWISKSSFNPSYTLTKVSGIITAAQLNGPLSKFTMPLSFPPPSPPVNKATMTIGTNMIVNDFQINFAGASITGVVESSTESAPVAFSLLNKTRLDLQKQIEHNTFTIFDLNDKIENFDIGDALTGVNDDIAAATADISTVKTDIISVNGNISTLRTDLNTVTGNLNTVTGNLSTVTGNLSTVTSSLATVRSDLTTVSGNLSTITSGLTTVNTNLSTVTADTQTIKDLLAEYNIANMASTIDTLQAENESLRSNLLLLRNQIQEYITNMYNTDLSISPNLQSSPSPTPTPA